MQQSELATIAPSHPAPADGGASDVVDKFEVRRRELADATLETLGELGYARTSLREIASNTRLSHGSLHYYFKDKLDLITFGMRRYNDRCTRRYDDILDADVSAEEFARRITDRMVATMQHDTAMHKLWYDLRTQAMFEAELAPSVQAIDAELCEMVRRIATRYAKLRDVPLAVPADLAYAVIDGLFESCLLASVLDDPSAEPRLRAGLDALLKSIVAG